MNKVMYQIDFRDWSLVTMPTMGHLDQPQQAAPFIVLERLKHCSGTVLNGVNRENHTFISPISWHLCVHVDISANNSLQFGTLINRGNTFRHTETTCQFYLLLLESLDSQNSHVTPVLSRIIIVPRIRSTRNNKNGAAANSADTTHGSEREVEIRAWLRGNCY